VSYGDVQLVTVSYIEVLWVVVIYGWTIVSNSELE